MVRIQIHCVLLTLAASFALAGAQEVELESPSDIVIDGSLPKARGESFPVSVCGPPGCTWIRAEALLWWTNGADSPPLVATGILGDPGTTVLFGDEPINDSLRAGLRLRAGRWMNCEHTCGWEAGFFWLGNDGDGFTATSQLADGSDIVRPFIDANTGLPSAELVPGTVTVDTGSNLIGVDLLRRCNWCCCCCGWDPCDCSKTCIRRDFLFGFRYLGFSDRITITENLEPDDPIIVPGTLLDITDDFRSYNNFYGLKLGLALERYRGPWSLEARPQVSFGLLDRRTTIDGNTVVSIPGVPVQENEGGLYALSSNIGDYSSQQFAVVPELDLNVGYLIRPNLRLLLGYSLIYIPNVQRAAGQIDPVINPNLLPPVIPPVVGPARPAFPDRNSDLWVQGLSLGMEWRF